MDYKKAAQQVLDNIGGASNIVSAAHCATRLRLEVKDSSAVNEKAVKLPVLPVSSAVQDFLPGCHRA